MHWMQILIILVFGLKMSFPAELPARAPTLWLAKFDFEDGRVDRWALEGNKDHFTFATDSALPHSGRYSARLNLARGSDKARHVLTTLRLPTETPWKSVLIRFFMRSSDLADGDIVVNLLERTAKGPSWISGKSPYLPLRGCADWTSVELRAPLTPGATTFTFYLSVRDTGLARGTLWIDDLSFECDAGE
ncbi:MAG: hypothetical protein J0L75_04940 [Spirochaetes bacterium]|nr:hypothetical protein [Spirochaetota bacterium]